MYDQEVLAELERAAGNPAVAGANIGSLTSLGCGGAAALLIEAESSERLAQILHIAAAHEVDWFVFGLGSNLLVADSGWDGMVIRLAGDLKQCIPAQDGRLTCGGGATLPKAASVAAAAGLSGLEALAGIPGTIGGAVAMNAGAWGTDIGSLTERITLCLPGETREIGRDFLKFSYRHCELPPGAVISRVVLALSLGETESIKAEMTRYREQRTENQPVGERTCGSVFRNPPEGMSAGELLERAGCKGLQHRGASISTRHANFIVNQGGVSADVIWLMNECRRLVYEKFGVVLEPEVMLLGDIELKDPVLR